jgi:hypothetical protein
LEASEKLTKKVSAIFQKNQWLDFLMLFKKGYYLEDVSELFARIDLKISGKKEK